ncbi:antibiotic biosynthesis monooxygenase family protein [Diaminobutyricibacter sp. McL0618]|uniref:antibiotic biosynthesis monooxygenase family protein n=1 Tax=Leifsonia sp. McL0618 TaxID=3415677 RepID=UPI003CEEB106
MYTSTFIFHAKPYDADFHRLNDEIAERARQIPGFLGEEEWTNEESGLYSEVYYWETLEALHQLIGMDTHREAKRQHERWIGAHRVVIAEVISTYGDSGLGLEHVPTVLEVDV